MKPSQKSKSYQKKLLLKKKVDLSIQSKNSKSSKSKKSKVEKHESSSSEWSSDTESEQAPVKKNLFDSESESLSDDESKHGEKFEIDSDEEKMAQD